MVNLRHTRSELLEFLLHISQAREHRHAFGEDGAPGKGESILGKISGSNSFGYRDAAVIQSFRAGKNFQKRRFAGAICAHQTDAVVRRDQQINAVEQQFVAIAFSGGI